MAATTTTTAPTVNTVFAFDDHNLILSSSDGVLFHVHQQNLKSHSHVFEDMFSMDLPEGEQPVIGPIQLTESAHTLENILPFCYDGAGSGLAAAAKKLDPPNFDDWSYVQIQPIFEAAHKYGIEKALQATRKVIEKHTRDSPKLYRRVALLATRFDDPELGKVAAEKRKERRENMRLNFVAIFFIGMFVVALAEALVSSIIIGTSFVSKPNSSFAIRMECPATPEQISEVLSKGSATCRPPTNWSVPTVLSAACTTMVAFIITCLKNPALAGLLFVAGTLVWIASLIGTTMLAAQSYPSCTPCVDGNDLFWVILPKLKALDISMSALAWIYAAVTVALIVLLESEPKASPPEDPKAKKPKP